MPVMDGKQAAAAIRKYEELLDPRLALNALLESQKVELGIDFDGWMLKPIDFKRMLQILVGISEPDKRKEDAYERGKWERGGWLNGELRDTAYSCAVLTATFLRSLTRW
jgi:hypothetical protein